MDSRPVPGDDRPDDPDEINSRWAEIVAELGDLDGFADPAPGPEPGAGPILPPPRRRSGDVQENGAETAPDGAGSPAGGSGSQPGRVSDGVEDGEEHAEDHREGRADERGADPGATRPGERRRGGRVIRPAVPEGPEGTEVPPDPGAFGPRSWSVDPATEEAEDHFVPPDPGPVLGGDPLLTLAWGAVIAVPLLVLIATLFWRDIPVVVLQIAGAAFLAGVGLLVWRMPRHHDPDDDNGAVV